MSDLHTIRQRRKQAEKVNGPFVTAMVDALSEYRRMRIDGVSREDAVKGLALVVKESWPRGRAEPWKVYCESCQDTGLRTVKKPSTLYGGADAEWKEPCQCQKGRIWHENHQPKRDTPQTVAASAAREWS